MNLCQSVAVHGFPYHVDVVAVARFMVFFDHPSAAQRKALWRSALPPRVPLASDVDFEARRPKARACDDQSSYVSDSHRHHGTLKSSADAMLPVQELGGRFDLNADAIASAAFRAAAAAVLRQGEERQVLREDI